MLHPREQHWLLQPQHERSQHLYPDGLVPAHAPHEVLKLLALAQAVGVKLGLVGDLLLRRLEVLLLQLFGLAQDLLCCNLRPEPARQSAHVLAHSLCRKQLPASSTETISSTPIESVSAARQQSARASKIAKASKASSCPRLRNAVLTRLLRSRLLVLDLGGAREPNFGVPLRGAAYSAHGASCCPTANEFYAVPASAAAVFLG